MTASPPLLARLRESPLYDGNGRRVVYAQALPYDAAQRGRRAAGMGRHGMLGANHALAASRTTLVGRIRHQLRNHPQLDATVKKVVGQIIGARGIRPESRAPLESERRAHAREWAAWADDPAACDLTGETTFYGQQARVCYLTRTDGECFARLHTRTDRPAEIDDGLDDWRVPLQVQILPTELVPDDLHERRQNGNVIRHGVEFDRLGRVVAYWVLPTHPDDATFGVGSSTPERIPAGEMLHIRDALNPPGVVRGIPSLARILMRLRDADEYDDAQLQRQLAAALHVFFTHTPTGGVPAAFAELAAEQAGSTVAGAAVGDSEFVLETGAVIGLAPGEQVTAPPAPSMGDDYEIFTRRTDRQLAAGMDAPVWDYSGEFDRVNFTSSRVGLMPLRDLWAMWVEQTLVPQFCAPVFRWFMRRAAVAGFVTMRRFRRDPRPYLGATWRGEGFEWVQPLDEANAARVRLESGISTLSEEIAARGRNFADVVEEQRNERRAMQAAGVTVGGGVGQPDDPADAPDDMGTDDTGTDDEESENDERAA